jgi:hypothetical protein
MVHIYLHDAAGERLDRIRANTRRLQERRWVRAEARRQTRARDSVPRHWSDAAARELRPERSSPEEIRLLTRLVNDAQDLSRVNLTRLAGSGTSYGQIAANKEFARRLKETDWNAPERQYRVRRS